MNYIEKKLHCETLNIPVIAKYFIGEFNLSGTRIKKVVKYYDCSAKYKCLRDYNVKECNCFREMVKIEKNIALEV